MDDKKKVIQAGRRRHTEDHPEGRERAETPQRRETGQGSERPPSYGGFGGAGGTGGGSLPQLPFPSGGKFSLKSCIGLAVLLILAVCVLIVFQYPSSLSEN